MNNSILIYTGLLLFWTSVLLFSVSEEDKKLWAEIDSPNLDGQIQLYQKERKMHQAPEILVYFQRRGSKRQQPIGNILLPEDNRSKISYDYKWQKKQELTLKLTCEPCMIEERDYIINLEHKTFISGEL